MSGNENLLADYPISVDKDSQLDSKSDSVALMKGDT
jgi:hypothetical protein